MNGCFADNDGLDSKCACCNFLFHNFRIIGIFSSCGFYLYSKDVGTCSMGGGVSSHPYRDAVLRPSVLIMECN